MTITTFFFFFFNDTATTEIYTLSLHELFRSLNPELLQAVERHAGPDTTDWPPEFVRIPPQHEGGRGGTATRGEQYDDPGDAGSTGEHDAPPRQGKHNILFQGAIGHVSHPSRAAHRRRARHRGR